MSVFNFFFFSYIGTYWVMGIHCVIIMAIYNSKRVQLPYMDRMKWTISSECAILGASIISYVNTVAKAR